MKTIDINILADIALVQDDDGKHTRYEPLTENNSTLDLSFTRQVYLGQLHYVAGHKAVGLIVNDRLMPNGEKYPKTGWTRWRPV